MNTDISSIEGYIQKFDGLLIPEMLNTLDILKDLDINGGVIRNLRETRILPKLIIDKGVRPFNTGIETEKGGRVWSKREITPRQAMKIIKIIPQELRETFLSEMMRADATEIPFHQWVWAQEMAKIASELNDNLYNSTYHDKPVKWQTGTSYQVGDLVYYNEIVYKCTINAAAGENPENTANKWEDVDNRVICDGPGTIIQSEIEGNNLVPINTGSFDDTDAVKTITGAYKEIPEVVRNKPMILRCSLGVLEDYIEDHNNRFGTGQGNGVGSDLESGNTIYLRGSNRNCVIRPATWMKGSRRLIFERPGNITMGIDQMSDHNKVSNTVKLLHGYKSLVSMILSFQIKDLDALFVNDQV